MRSVPFVTDKTLPRRASTSLPPNIADKVDAHAREREITRGAAIAELVADGLKARQILKEQTHG